MKLYKAGEKKIMVSMRPVVYVVDGDWVPANTKKHLEYLLPKLIKLMFENKRPMEDIKIILDLYAYYWHFVKAGYESTPILVVKPGSKTSVSPV